MHQRLAGEGFTPLSFTGEGKKGGLRVKYTPEIGF